MQRQEQAAASWAALRGDARRRRLLSDVVVDGPWPGAGRASLWPLSQVIAAALDLRALGLIGARTVKRVVRSRWVYRWGSVYAAAPLSGERYYDDNAWLGLDLVQAAALEGSTRYLRAARAVLRFCEAGSRDGGVHWVEHPARSRHTCSTGPAAELAFRLAAQGEPGAGVFGEAAMGFLARELRGPDGLYADNIADDGTVEPTVWSYNQGTPVGAGALWGRLSGDDRPIATARETADAALAHFAREDRLWRQPPAFNAIFLRNILLLDGIAGYPPVQGALDAYLDRAWDEARDVETGWFTGGGIGRYERGGSLDQAGFVQLYALAAWPRSWRDRIC